VFIVEMKPRTMFVMVMLGLLLVANILMVAGFTNYPSRSRDLEGFANYLENAAPAGKEYQPIGAYDGVMKVPANGLSAWRDKAPNEPLLGPEVEVGPDNLFIFKNNQCKPECCGASFSCGGGCVCTTAKQRDYINSRGGNRTSPDDGI
jgi:hypothetical protein